MAGSRYHQLVVDTCPSAACNVNKVAEHKALMTRSSRTEYIKATQQLRPSTACCISRCLVPRPMAGHMHSAAVCAAASLIRCQTLRTPFMVTVGTRSRLTIRWTSSTFPAGRHGVTRSGRRRGSAPRGVGRSSGRSRCRAARWCPSGRRTAQSSLQNRARQTSQQR